MIDWIIQELQWKAGVLQDLGFVTVFDVAVTKSDVAIPKQLQHDLQRAAAPLENIPDERKDYHPGSHNKVVDLVHPALFPVIYGRSRILPDRRIGLDDCLLHMGRGEVLPVPAEDEAAFVGESGGRNPFWDDDGPYPFSRKFQWLPCDVEFTDEDPGCRVVSYINNAHPLEHRALYGVVERVIARAIPLWSRSLTPRPSVQDSRIPYGGVDYLPHPEPEPQPRQEDGEDSDSEAYLDRHDEWEESCPIEQPEPGEFKVETVDPKDKVDLRAQFRETGLQVIVKLSNIELTPEKPEYEGGSWHIEGQLVQPPICIFFFR